MHKLIKASIIIFNSNTCIFQNDLYKFIYAIIL